MKSLRLTSSTNVLRRLVATLVVAFLMFSTLTVFLGVAQRMTAHRYESLLNGNVKDTQQVLRMQVAFKIQVQDWKDTLLRGSDPTQLAKYSGQFHNDETTVQNLGKQIVATTRDANVSTKTQDFLNAHQAMNDKYEASLSAFVASGGKNFAAADAMVKGQDRAPTDALTALVNYSSDRSNKQARANRNFASITEWCSYGATAVLVVLIALGVGLVVRSLVSAVRSNVVRLRDESDQLVAVSSSATRTAEHSADQARVVAASAQTVEQSVQAVAAAIEEMSATVQEIAHNASEANQAASSAVQRAEHTNQTVSRLGEASAEIGAVIGVITSIAEQTNLLALNATIEAARAGESGKGFAVVANEVKELANQTAKATEEIGQRITAIQAEANDAVTAISEISSVIAHVDELQASIAGAVEEQSATTAEIGRSVTEAAAGVSQITGNVADLSDRIAETAGSAATSREVSTGVAEVATQLEALVGRNVADNETHWTHPGADRRFGGVEPVDSSKIEKVSVYSPNMIK